MSRLISIPKPGPCGTLTIPFLDPEAHNNFGGLNIEGHARGESVDVVRIDDYTLPRCN